MMMLAVCCASSSDQRFVGLNADLGRKSGSTDSRSDPFLPSSEFAATKRRSSQTSCSTAHGRARSFEQQYRPGFACTASQTIACTCCGKLLKAVGQHHASDNRPEGAPKQPDHDAVHSAVSLRLPLALSTRRRHTASDISPLYVRPRSAVIHQPQRRFSNQLQVCKEGICLFPSAVRIRTGTGPSAAPRLVSKKQANAHSDKRYLRKKLQGQVDI